MTAFNFPDTTGKPTDGSFTYPAPDGTVYKWNGYAWQVQESSGGGGGGGGDAARVATQVFPPSPAVDGDMYWCTDDGRLYIYYNEDSTDPNPNPTSQWVDASPENTLAQYWSRTGDTLNPTADGDSVDIGSGNITLNADGSAEFTGRLSTDQYYRSKNKTSQAGFIAYNDTGAARTDAALLISNNESDSSKTAEINYDGSATFAGQITSGVANGSLNTSGASIGPAGYCSINHFNRQTTSCFTINDTSIGSSVFSVNGNGSATFAGEILTYNRLVSGRSAQDGTELSYGITAYSNAGLASVDATVFARNYDSTGRVWCGASSGGSLTSAILGDGSAEFAGDITATYNASNSTKISSLGYGEFRRTGSGSIILGYSDNALNVDISADGSAKFTQTINGSVNRCNFTNNGSIAYFELRHNGNQNVFMNAVTGDALFTGTVTANGNVLTRNVVLNLEPDDDTKYTATTDVDGNETRIYNGATLDVKEMLLNFQAKIQTLEAAKAALEARVVTLETQQSSGN